MSDEKPQTPPDHLSVNPKSPHFDQGAREREREDPAHHRS